MNPAERANRREGAPDVLVSAAAVVPEDSERILRFVDQAVELLRSHYRYYELLLIDNGLSLRTHGLLEALQAKIPNVRVLRLSRRYPMEVALAAALDHCIGDYVVLMDPRVHPLDLIPDLIERARQGCDCVTGIPVIAERPLMERMLIGRLYQFASRILRVQLDPAESSFYVFSRRLVNAVVRIRTKHRDLNYLNVSVGLRRGVVYYEPPPDSPARSRRLFDSLVAVSNLLVSNTAVPLRFASLLGVGASIANIVYLGYILVVTLVKSRIAEGWLTTSVSQATMFLILFLMLTILSEYIARILNEIKEQPLYFIECESYSSTSEMDRERLNVLRDAGGAR